MGAVVHAPETQNMLSQSAFVRHGESIVIVPPPPAEPPPPASPPPPAEPPPTP